MGNCVIEKEDREVGMDERRWDKKIRKGDCYVQTLT